AYYQFVDPDGLRSTLGNWWQQNKFNKSTGAASNEAKAAYLNNNDLGFGRDMHMHVAGTNPDGSPWVAAYVSNYSLQPPVPDQNPFSADFAQAKDRTRAIATVCMEYSP